MINEYDIKLLHLIDDYNPYNVSTYEKTLKHIDTICYDPSFQPMNTHYVHAGKAAQRLVDYVHATTKYVHQDTQVPTWSKTMSWTLTSSKASASESAKALDSALASSCPS